MPKPVAVWNSARDVWETPQTEGFFCEHLDVFSGTFPTSGMTVNGAAYELPTWEPATDGSAYSSLLPTVTTQDGANNGGPSQFDRNTPPLNTRVLMLPTPTVSDTNGPGVHGDGGLDLRTTVSLLRTPCAAEAAGGARNPNRPGATMRLSDQIREQLLPTPVTTDAIGARNRTANRKPTAKKANIGDTLTDFAWQHHGWKPGDTTAPAAIMGQMDILDELED